MGGGGGGSSKSYPPIVEFNSSDHVFAMDEYHPKFQNCEQFLMKIIQSHMLKVVIVLAMSILWSTVRKQALRSILCMIPYLIGVNQ